MGRLIEIYDVNEFSRVRGIPDAAVTDTVRANIARLDEIHELEKLLREIMYDPTETPHGPTEIADILTSHIHILGEKRLAAFVLKGRGSQKVRSRDVTHQFLKLRTIAGLGAMIFVAVGHIQDDAQRDFVQSAHDAGCDYLIINAHQCARLLIAYDKICPQDGTPFDEKGVCLAGHNLDDGIPLNMTVREKVRYRIHRQEDISHAGAKRYSARVILDQHYPKDVIRDFIQRLTEELRNSRYYRNDQAKEHWGATPAHVVWLFIGYGTEDIENCNWACQTCWIDPHLPENMQPTRLDGNDRIGDIQIAWNDQYDGVKDFIEEHSTGKDEFLEQLCRIKSPMIGLGDKAIDLFTRYQHDTLSETSLISEMQSLQGNADTLYRDSGNLPFPPSDCKDYDQVCQSIFARIHNMFLFFSENGVKKWEKPRRDWLMQNTIRGYLEDLQRLDFEERKIH